MEKLLFFFVTNFHHSCLYQRKISKIIPSCIIHEHNVWLYTSQSWFHYKHEYPKLKLKLYESWMPLEVITAHNFVNSYRLTGDIRYILAQNIKIETIISAFRNVWTCNVDDECRPRIHWLWIWVTMDPLTKMLIDLERRFISIDWSIDFQSVPQFSWLVTRPRKLNRILRT